jgi:hypothetical protein
MCKSVAYTVLEKEVNANRMKTSFYDVKKRAKVETDIVDKKEYKVNGGVRYAVVGKTSDGRTLTKFVSKDNYDKTSV